jgi:hypothetical protein
LGRPFLWAAYFSPQRSRLDGSHRERRIASIIVTALPAAKIPMREDRDDAEAEASSTEAASATTT